MKKLTMVAMAGLCLTAIMASKAEAQISISMSDVRPEHAVCLAPFARDAYREEYSVNSWSDFRQQTLDFICSSRNVSTLREREGGIDIVIPEYNIPVAANYADARTNTEAEAMCRQQMASMSHEQATKVARLFVNNTPAYSAFIECIRLIRDEGITTQTMPLVVAPRSTFFVAITYKPRHTGARPIRVKRVEAVNAKCYVRKGTNVNINSTEHIRCKRTGDGPMSIVVHTRNGENPTLSAGPYEPLKQKPCRYTLGEMRDGNVPPLTHGGSVPFTTPRCRKLEQGDRAQIVVNVVAYTWNSYHIQNGNCTHQMQGPDGVPWHNRVTLLSGSDLQTTQTQDVSIMGCSNRRGRSENWSVALTQEVIAGPEGKITFALRGDSVRYGTKTGGDVQIRFQDSPVEVIPLPADQNQ